MPKVASVWPFISEELSCSFTVGNRGNFLVPAYKTYRPFQRETKNVLTGPLDAMLIKRLQLLEIAKSLQARLPRELLDSNFTFNQVGAMVGLQNLRNGTRNVSVRGVKSMQPLSKSIDLNPVFSSNATTTWRSHSGMRVRRPAGRFLFNNRLYIFYSRWALNTKFPISEIKMVWGFKLSRFLYQFP